MQNQIGMSVMAALTSDDFPPGRSRFALFLDGDPNNTSVENIIDEGFFDNCYSYDQFLEDRVFQERLLDQRDALQAELQKMKAVIDQMQSDLGLE